MKSFDEVLRDSFKHVTEIFDPVKLMRLRREGVQVDSEGYWSRIFGDRGEYELTIEPIGEENEYQIGLYKEGVEIIHKLLIWKTRKG